MSQKLSEQFRARIKLADQPAYKIAQKAGVDPTFISKLLHGYAELRPDDNRIQRLAKVLNFPAHQIFCGGDNE